MATREAAIAARRFGLGARPGELSRISADPRGHLEAQLASPAAARLAPELPAGHKILEGVQLARRDVRAARDVSRDKAGPQASPAGERPDGAPVPPGAASGPPTRQEGVAGIGIGEATAASGAGAGTSGNPAGATKPPPQEAAAEPRPARLLREAFLADLAARIAHSTATETPFIERLVLFWSNHFAVSAAKGVVRGLAGAFEREAIRPHVLGRFAQMLRAAAQHPAMLIYLDNAQSIGPKSTVGKSRARGLNENLAREILELHTLGVDGGYTQADVTALARLLTGWSVGQIELSHTEPGKFFFAAPRHEPGGATVLGRRYGEGGLAEGEAALADLARHPATARHIARKLARHFVSDRPPPALVARLEATFRTTDGDLAALARALVTADEAWAAPPAKIVPPYDFMVALHRGFGPLGPPLQVHRLAAALGQPTWTPPSPKGWPDEDDAWTGPAAIRERLRIAELAARRAGMAADPRALGPDLLGPALGEATREAIARAETREQGLELLIMSPEFQRR